jgi:AraC family transcriptional regulator, regulatory protein of adaptative response / methylated-DNA-[protein]-cysteine methyltransferase
MVQMRNFSSEQAKWHAVENKDARADGNFFYAVKTTGVYCRPNCAAKLAKRENVIFFETPADAERAGFRACKRCQPNADSQQEREAELVRRACESMRESEANIPLKELARAADLSPFYFQKVFKRVSGVTPREYATQLREQRAREALRKNDSVTGAIYDAGYNANSRFYARSRNMLGMQPRDFAAGGAGQAIRYAIAQSALGLVLIAGTERGICLVHFGESEAELESLLQKSFSRARILSGDSKFTQTVKAVIQSINESDSAKNLPLDLRGTVFQQRVWKALREIPPGTTTTYSKLAEKLGTPRAVRAVARACATNDVAVLVPCHRVIRADGNLAGYRWGLERKRKLLNREQNNIRQTPPSPAANSSPK